ncbi:hypothetical protein PRO82_001963 [Candidatus Protochlamydia amoebophila]|uniref:transposase n=1 Tax=Candidatus Protochlamydia amoebophila TaxID=362787 RepID=UPI001BC9DF7F|nr:hypothetical protein [Candidatus Protochlamydia amoebophila]
MHQIEKNFGKLFGEEGYFDRTCKEIFKTKIELLTTIKLNRKQKVIKLTEKIFLKKQAVV